MIEGPPVTPFGRDPTYLNPYLIQHVIRIDVPYPGTQRYQYTLFMKLEVGDIRDKC
jgi:hypothetical protein